MTLEILVILVLIGLNGLFAMSEMAIVSARRVRLQQRADAGSRRAQVALELAESPGRFLSTVQIGITLIGILAGTFGGATIAEELAGVLRPIPWLARYSEAIAVLVVVLAITYLSLVLGELAPKRFALTNAEGVAAAVAPLMQRLARLAAPAVWLLGVSTELVLRLVGARPASDAPVTEEDIRLMIRAGTESGTFGRAEQEMVEGVFRLADRTAGALMIPRPEVVWLDVDDSREAIREKVMQGGYSQFPVAEGDLDNVLGLAYSRDLLAQALGGRPLDLRAAVRPATFVPESMLAPQVLDRLRESRSEVVLVIDEYGGVQGLATVSDILEAIVGDLPTQGEEEAPQIVRRADGSWLVDGLLLVDELKEALPVGEEPRERKGDYQTVGGLVMACLGRIPAAGEICEWGGLRFEVADMDGRRVDKVIVSQIEPPGEGV